MGFVSPVCRDVAAQLKVIGFYVVFELCYKTS